MIKPKPPWDGRMRVARRAGDAIADALRDNHLDGAIREERLVTEWRALAGDRIAARTRSLGVTDRVLVIEVANTTWLHELTLLRAKLLAGLHERMGEPRIFDDLKFVLAGRARRMSGPTTRRPTAPPRSTPTPATGATREQILRDVERIADPELRALVADVRIKSGR